MADERPTAVVLLSGGMDSCVTTALAAQRFELALLHSSYGQRTMDRERECFRAVADHFGAKHRLEIDQGYMAQIGGSALTDKAIEVPDADLVAAAEGEIPATYVPFRNAHFLAAAISWAEVLGSNHIFVGAVEQDSSGYPDCRPEYYEIFNRLIQAGTRPETDIRIETPLIGLRKAEIIRQGVEIGAPLALTWSCYQAGQVACGRCDSCSLRLRAFAEAGVTDPVPYAPAA